VLPQRANVAYAPLRLLSAGSNSLPLPSVSACHAMASRYRPLSLNPKF